MPLHWHLAAAHCSLTLPSACLQSLFIVILTSSGALTTTDEDGNTTSEGTQLQELLICLEMLPASIAMLWAFNYNDYKGTGKYLKHHCIAITACWEGSDPVAASACIEEVWWYLRLDGMDVVEGSTSQAFNPERCRQVLMPCLCLRQGCQLTPCVSICCMLLLL